MDELWRALRGAPGLVEHADALTRLNRSRGIASLMITHSLADLEALPTRADVAKARGFVERSAIVVLGGLPRRELDAVSAVVPLTPGERDLVAAWSSAESWQPGVPPRARPLPDQDRGPPRPAGGDEAHRRRTRPLRHRHPGAGGAALMRPAPLGPRAGMPPEMATPLALIAAIWGALAVLGLLWVTGAAAGWVHTDRWDPPPFALDTAGDVLARGPADVFGAPAPHLVGVWGVLGVALCVALGSGEPAGRCAHRPTTRCAPWPAPATCPP